MAASDNLNSRQFSVHTQHAVDGQRVTKRKHFADYDSAHAHATANNPDTDGSMYPQVDDKLASHPDYEAGMYYANSTANRYAVITKKGNRKLGTW